ncbi:hypothetical protein CEXT_667331 [Caerostris extrusa]|uniref:Uncharacterized protein n=1 Tax=Caerostris extrusa TaxID=172846 RepID=A0AAV4UW03_CAEEX|nr:hypothetical protein CEXT_667331 [Caerostris extrusa]
MEASDVISRIKFRTPSSNPNLPFTRLLWLIIEKVDCRVPINYCLRNAPASDQNMFFPGMVPEPPSQIPEAGEAATEGTRSALCAPHLQRRHDAQHLPHRNGRLEGLPVPSPNAMNSMGGRYQPMASSYPAHGRTALLHGTRQP